MECPEDEGGKNIQSTEKRRVIIHLKDADADFDDGVPYVISLDSPLRSVFESYARDKNVRLTDLEFTYDMLPISTSEEVTARQLGMGDDHCIAVEGLAFAEEEMEERQSSDAQVDEGGPLERAKELLNRRSLEWAMRHFVPMPHALVLFIVTRVSPYDELEVFAKEGYYNDGIGQIVQIIMEVQLLQELFPGLSIQFYPAVCAGDGVSRYSGEESPAIAQCLHAVSMPNLQNNPLAILFRDSIRFHDSPEVLQKLRNVSSLLHPNVRVLEAENILLDIFDIKTLTFERNQSLKGMPANHRNVTQELTRNDEDEEAQGVIRNLVKGLKKTAPSDNPLLIKIHLGTQLAESIPSAIVELLRTHLEEKYEEVKNGRITASKAAADIIEYVQGMPELFVLEQALLDLEYASYSRCSPGARESLSFADFIETHQFEGSAMLKLRWDQAMFNIAALLHEFGEVTTSNLLAAFFQDDEKSRRCIFNPMLIALLILCILSDKLKAVVIATLVRFGADPVVVDIVLCILDQRGIDLIISKNFGFKFSELKAQQQLGDLERELIWSKFHEQMEELVQKIPEQLRHLHPLLQKVCRIAPRQHDVGKAFTAKLMTGPSSSQVAQQGMPSRPVRVDGMNNLIEMITAAVKADQTPRYEEMNDHGGKVPPPKKPRRSPSPSL